MTAPRVEAGAMPGFFLFSCLHGVPLFAEGLPSCFLCCELRHDIWNKQESRGAISPDASDGQLKGG